MADPLQPPLDQIPLEPIAYTNDGFFKAIFSQPEHARAFFRSHLPASIAREIDWPSLTALPGSFVKSSLQQVHSDLLFTASIGNRAMLLYLLFEHQSCPDPAMPLRLLTYILEILRQHHNNHGLPLPPVLPLVLHQGPETWSVSAAFEDLFALSGQLSSELAADLLPFLPKFQYALLDLSRFEPATEEADIHLRVVLQLMKLARQKELLRFFDWLAAIPASQMPDNLLSLMLLYALHADSDLDARKIFHTLSPNPQLKRNAMSVAEKLKAEGLMEGLTKGRVEGRVEGLWIGRIQSLEEFLGLPVSSAEVLEALSLEELEAMQLRLRAEYEARFKRS